MFTGRYSALSQIERFDFSVPSDKSGRKTAPVWYPVDEQRKFSCGAVAAAMQFSYLAAIRPGFSGLCPNLPKSKASFMDYIETVSKSLPTDRKGLCTSYLFKTGALAFAAQQSCNLYVRELDVPRLRLARPSFSQCAAFIRAGLAADCPVAFLCLSGGRSPLLENRGWVTLIAMEQRPTGQAFCTILTGSRKRIIDFRQWYQNAAAGGGLVYFVGGEGD